MKEILFVIGLTTIWFDTDAIDCKNKKYQAQQKLKIKRKTSALFLLGECCNNGPFSGWDLSEIHLSTKDTEQNMINLN